MSDLGQQLIQAVVDAAKQNPDHVYAKDSTGACVYVRDGQPSCLLGKALWELGLIGAELEYQLGNYSDLHEMACNLGIWLDPDERAWLSVAQDRQDQGVPWGKAIRPF